MLAASRERVVCVNGITVRMIAPESETPEECQQMERRLAQTVVRLLREQEAARNEPTEAARN